MRGNREEPSPHLDLKRGGVSVLDRLKPHGVLLCAWDERDSETAVIQTSVHLPAHVRTDAGTFCWYKFSI